MSDPSQPNDLTPEQFKKEKMRAYMREYMRGYLKTYYKRCSPETYAKMMIGRAKSDDKLVSCDCDCGRILPLKLRSNHRYLKKKNQAKLSIVV